MNNVTDISHKTKFLDKVYLVQATTNIKHFMPKEFLGTKKRERGEGFTQFRLLC